MGLTWAKRKTQFRCVGSLSGQVTMPFLFLSAFIKRVDPNRKEFVPVYSKSQKLPLFSPDYTNGASVCTPMTSRAPVLKTDCRNKSRR